MIIDDGSCINVASISLICINVASTSLVENLEFSTSFRVGEENRIIISLSQLL